MDIFGGVYIGSIMVRLGGVYVRSIMVRMKDVCISSNTIRRLYRQCYEPIS
jgi:hypothetical protein